MSNDLPDTSTPSERPARSPKRYQLVMKLVRRTHMLLVFGISGMLFNHPNLGEDVKVREISSEQLRSLTGLEPVQAGEIAREVVARLNTQNNGPGDGQQPPAQAKPAAAAVRPMGAAPAPEIMTRVESDNH